MTVNMNKLDFKVHPNILKQLVFDQHGSPVKALLELVQNSVDAGATKIDIKTSSSIVFIMDDGKGFGSKEEIGAVFQTFGSPQEADKKFGRYRIGRGQVFSMGKVFFRSNYYGMRVNLLDSQVNDFGFMLEEYQDFQPGCLVSIDSERVLNSLSRLSEQLFYLDVPVYLDNKLITSTSEPLSQKHSCPDESCFDFKVYDATSADMYYMEGNLSIFNQGIYVKSYEIPGLIGQYHISSTSNLPLNTARNELLNQDAFLSELLPSVFNFDINYQITKVDWRERSHRKSIFAQILLGNLNYRSDFDLFNKKLILSSKGDWVSFSDLSKFDSFFLPSSSSQNSSLARAMKKTSSDFSFNYEFSNSISAILLKCGGVGYSFSVNSLFEEVLLQFMNNNGLYRDGSAFKFSDNEQFLLATTSDNRILKESELSSGRQSALFSAVKSFYTYHMGGILLNAGLQSGREERRALLVGDSNGRDEAWTDGETYIAIDISILNHEPFRNLKTNSCSENLRLYRDTIQRLLYRIYLLIFHEYNHNSESELLTTHSLEFYQGFHDALFSDGGLSVENSISPKNPNFGHLCVNFRIGPADFINYCMEHYKINMLNAIYERSRLFLEQSGSLDFYEYLAEGYFFNEECLSDDFPIPITVNRQRFVAAKSYSWGRIISSYNLLSAKPLKGVDSELVKADIGQINKKICEVFSAITNEVPAQDLVRLKISSSQMVTITFTQKLMKVITPNALSKVLSGVSNRSPLFKLLIAWSSKVMTQPHGIDATKIMFRIEKA